MKARTVLMYHAIVAGDAVGADPHYSVSPGRFERQLALIAEQGGRPASVRELLVADGHVPQPVATGTADGRSDAGRAAALRPTSIGPHAEAAGRAGGDARAGAGASAGGAGGAGGAGNDPGSRQGLPRHPVCLTFDDGHLSNARAAESIARHGGSAEFFINPSMVGKPGFLDWPALREMAALGMSIQSHGMHHRYLDQLSPAEVQAELADSRAAIEDAIGQPVTIYAPAGGRMPAGFMATAHRLGYLAVCSSRAGVWRHTAATPAGEAIEIARLAMLHDTDERRFIAWITQHPVAMFKQQARHQVLSLSKRLLGNQGHERLRTLLLGSRTEAAVAPPATSAASPANVPSATSGSRPATEMRPSAPTAATMSPTSSPQATTGPRGPATTLTPRPDDTPPAASASVRQEDARHGAPASPDTAS